MELVERRPKPNFFPGLGGKGGRCPSSEDVLPALCLAGCAPDMNALCSYFCRMNLSITPSASSTSIGIEGLTFFGLNVRFEVLFPTRFIVCLGQRTISLWIEKTRTSTCSVFQLSILRDLTLEICVPNFRCNEAHRTHRKMPNCPDINASSEEST